MQIRIHRAPEYGSNMDPDSQDCLNLTLFQGFAETLLLHPPRGALSNLLQHL